MRELQFPTEAAGILYFAYEEVSVGRSSQLQAGRRRVTGNGGAPPPSSTPLAPQFECQGQLAHLCSGPWLRPWLLLLVLSPTTPHSAKPVTLLLLLSLRLESGIGDVETTRSKNYWFPPSESRHPCTHIAGLFNREGERLKWVAGPSKEGKRAVGCGSLGLTPKIVHRPLPPVTGQRIATFLAS